MKGGKALPLQYPPVSWMTAKLHENKSLLWLCFGRGGEKKTKKNTSPAVWGFIKIMADCWEEMEKLQRNVGVLLPLHTTTWRAIKLYPF